MKDRLMEALKKNTADYAEIRYETNDSNRLGYRGKEMENMSSSRFSGGIVRACRKGGWGQAKFDSLDDLEGQVSEACRCAELVGREKTELAEVPPVDARKPAVLKRDFRSVPLDEKIKLVSGYNAIVLGHDPAIESSHLSYADSFRTVHFASTRGNYFMEERPRVIVGMNAVGRKDGLVQYAHDSWASSDDYAVVLGLDDKVKAVTQRAVDLLSAPQCEGGPHTVVLDPDLAGVFIHEAFGHLSEADFLYENDKMRELMKPGLKIGVADLTVVDDGSMGVLQGTSAFDDEGTPTRKTHLITNGILTGHLHSLETAGKMGAKPTGNARAVGRGHPPIVRMTNTYIEGGKVPFAELVRGIDRGIYACDMLGGQTEMEMFTFTAAYGYRIERGKVGPLVRDIVLTGNVFETLKSIDGFGDDFRMSEGGGGCGKGGQSPLPVSFGSAHIRIRNVVIGGRQGGG
jgi:TldD protein